MKLFLLRHAHTEKVKKGMTDFDREIDHKGKSQLNNLQNFISEHYADTSFQVFCSTARRTRTTFNSIRSSLNVEKDHFSFHDELYLPSRDRLLHFLWNAEQRSEIVLVISHNNGISDLATYLLEEPISMSTGGWIEISFEGFSQLDQISRGLGTRTKEFYP
tara:strand:+ start:18518 stop:19000 length:483 start_codon:yes stop_codon:yes gene_type:complete